MAEGLFTVAPDGSLVVDQREGQPSTALDERLSTFAEPVHTTALQTHYRVTATSIWRARREGLSLEDITHALETYCEGDRPASLLADVELWSQQIDRLWLETDQGRLILRSQNPRLISAVLRQPTLRRFIKQKIDTHALELRAETETSLMQAFDDAQYPMLDRRREEHATAAPRSNAKPTGRRRRRKKGSQKRPPQEAADPMHTAPIPPTSASAQTDDLFDVFRSQLANRCQAITRTGRRCKNRVRPPDDYCRIHMELASIGPDDDQTVFSQHTFQYMLNTGLITAEQMAWFRSGLIVAIGLSTWLLNSLLMWIGVGWLDLPLSSWFIAPIAFLLICGLVSQLVPEGNLKVILLLLLVSFLSILMGFLNKEGLILNICSVLIPFVLPLYLLYRYSLSGWWSLLFIPVGIFVGWAFYHILEASSE